MGGVMVFGFYGGFLVLVLGWGWLLGEWHGRRMDVVLGALGWVL